MDQQDIGVEIASGTILPIGQRHAGAGVQPKVLLDDRLVVRHPAVSPNGIA
ncbi:MAG: hypothetical protein ABI414_01765 [Devosia sp.]